MFAFCFLVAAPCLSDTKIIQGVVQSPVTLPCDAAVDISNIRFVMWTLNTTYLFTNDIEGRFIRPVNYDHKYSFINDSNLVISSLSRSDSGTFECGVGYRSNAELGTSKVHLNVLGKDDQKSKSE